MTERTLQDSRFPPYALMRYFEEGYLSNPSKQALIGTGEAYSYSEAYLRSKVLAYYFANELGLGPSSVITLSSPNYIELPIIVAAAQACGAMMVMCSGRAEPQECVQYARISNPDLFIVCRPDACEPLEEAYPELTVMTLKCEAEGHVSIGAAIAKHRRQGMGYDPSVEGDPRIVLFSSGSTGTPKAIVNRSSSFYHTGNCVAKGYRISSDDVLYLPVPFFHSYGMNGLYAALSRGATVVTLLKYRSESSLSIIESARVTVYFGVPTMYLREMRVNADDEWDLSSLRLAKIAGAPCPEPAVEEFERRYQCKMLPSYGMTETAPTLTMADYDSSLHVRAAGVGKPIDGVEIKLDPETGELLCKSVALMDGLLQEDGSVVLDLDEDGWFHTGDVATVDEDGNYFIVGRIKDVVIRGGVNIYPAEIESFYQSHPSVAESCMVGYPDPELGERTCLCVIEKEGSDETASALRDYAKGRLEKCKIPDVVLKMDSFPRLANDKTDKAALRRAVCELLHVPQGATTVRREG